MKRIVIGVALLGVLAVAASAPASVVVTQDNGTTNQLTALTGYATTGGMMGGMTLTANFSSGGPETVTWVDLTSTAGKAVGTGWALCQSGDTFSSNWRLAVNSSTSLTSLVIDGGPGDTVFDRTFGGAVGTPGSALGKDFSMANSSGLAIKATYRNQVAVTGNSPVGDLFRHLEIDFTTIPLTNRTICFLADTDNSKGDIEPVPEPSTLAIWSLLGLCGIGWRRRRKA